MSEPSLAEAEQSLGFLHLKKNELDDAEKHFQRAAQLDPKDALTYYGLGGLEVIRAGNRGVPEAAAKAFEKAVVLNPDFAPAWYGLSAIYSQRNETLREALSNAQRAASLVPGDSEYQLAVATLLDRLGEADDARKIAAGVQESTSDRDTAKKAGDLIARMSKPQPVAAPAPVSNAPAKPTSDSGLRIERKTEPEAKPSPASTGSATPRTEPAPAAAPPLFSATKVYSMVGTITDVNCASAPQIQITLKSLTILMKLHAAELAKVSIKSAGSDPAAKGTICSNLKGRSARISYTLVLDKPWDGEMQELEFRSQP
jgi:hypothetical protein